MPSVGQYKIDSVDLFVLLLCFVSLSFYMLLTFVCFDFGVFGEGGLLRE